MNVLKCGIAALFIIGFAIAAPAQELTPQSKIADLEWGANAGGFELAAAAPKSHFELGEPILIKVALRSMVRKAYIARLDPIDFHSIVTDSNGNVLPSHYSRFGELDTTGISGVSLDPSTVFTELIRIDGRYDLKPGAYRLRVWADIHDAGQYPTGQRPSLEHVLSKSVHFSVG